MCTQCACLPFGGVCWRLEEWQLMLSHYCAALAVCEDPSSSLLARLRLLHPIGAEAAADTAEEGEGRGVSR